METTNGTTTTTIEVLYVPSNPQRRIEALKREAHNFTQIAVRSKNVGRVPSGAEWERRFRSARMFLDWAQANLEMTPDIRSKTKIDLKLEFAFKYPNMHFPPDIRDKARALYSKWAEENWGASAVVEDEDVDDSDGQQDIGGGGSGSGTGTGHTAADNGDDETPTAQIALPDPNDPVFRPGGMMHGVLRQRSPASGRITYVMDPRVARVSAKVFGHNGIAPGTWYPLQAVALARGAHGAKQAGIAGDTALGAYSIVVSGTYDDLDRDLGATLFYSGSNSHKNADPARPPESSTGTKALKASLRTRNPVRVLRAGGPSSKNRWAPDRGIRYDGLYRVVRMLTPINTNGGMYEQFELERLPGQPSLEEICRTSPTPQQKFDWDRIQQGN